MAERRMMSKKITDTDAFLDMPLSTQALYFHFIQNADDDGFVGSPNSIIRKIGANRNDYDLLIAKRFIIQFESGICVIKHWRIHNYIQNDRYTPTTYLKEKSLLEIEENKSYTDKKYECIQNVSNMDTQYSIDKYSIDKNSIEYNCTPKVENNSIKHRYGEFKHVLLTDEQYNKLKEQFPNDYEERIKNLDEGIEIHKYKYSNHLLVIQRWAKKENKNQKSNTPQQQDKGVATEQDRKWGKVF